MPRALSMVVLGVTLQGLAMGAQTGIAVRISGVVMVNGVIVAVANQPHPAQAVIRTVKTSSGELRVEHKGFNVVVQDPAAAPGNAADDGSSTPPPAAVACI